MRRTALLLSGVLLTGCGAGAVPVSSSGPDLSQEVPQDGDTVTGAGRLVQEAGGPVLFCGFEFRTGVGTEPEQPPPTPVGCRDGVPVTGADLSALQDRYERAGAVEGYASITGTWADGGVTVQEQATPPAPDGRVPDDVPCPAPDGGWPRSPEGEDEDALVERTNGQPALHAGVPDRFALLRPSDDQVVLGFTVPDEPTRLQALQVLAELELEDRSCVVVADHSEAQLTAVRAAGWSGVPGARSHGVDLVALQAVYAVDALVVTPELADEAARHPAGLVRLDPYLRVVARPDRLEPAPAATADPTAAALDPRVPVEGSRVSATGSVRPADGQRPVTLCHPDQLTPLVLLPDGQTWPCLGVELRGLSDLPAGDVRVVGRWRSGAVDVEQVLPAEPSSGYPGLPEVPCPAPAGGWPDGGAPYDDRSPDDGAMIRFGESHPELSRGGRVMLLRPAADRQVVTVVVRDAGEAARVEAALAPDFPGRTCVVVQDADVEASSRVEDDLRLTEEQLMISGFDAWGEGLRTRTRVVRVLHLSEQLLAAERDAGGLLVLEPWLSVSAD